MPALPPSICINGRFLTRCATGVDRYAREIVRELDDMVERGTFVLAVPGASEVIDPLPLESIEVVRLGARNGHLWEQLDLARYVKKNNLLPVNLCNTAPFFNPGVVCIHDMNFRANPSFYSVGFRTLYRVMLHFLTRNASAILTDSLFSKTEIEEYYPEARGRISVIPCAWQHIERIEADDCILAREDLESGGYYFAMSSLAPNKNLKWLVETARLNPESAFAIAGGINSKVFGTHDIPEAENVKYLGYVTDGEAKALMQNCRAFLFPTFYEGFGIPPMEAIACGAPVIVSDTAVMHEIYGDSVAYVDPHVACRDVGRVSSGWNSHGEQVLGKYSWKKSASLLLKAI